MAARYQKARLAIAGALAVAVVGGTAYFAEASAPQSESTSAATGSSTITVQSSRQQTTAATRVKRTRSS